MLQRNVCAKTIVNTCRDHLKVLNQCKQALEQALKIMPTKVIKSNDGTSSK